VHASRHSRTPPDESKRLAHRKVDWNTRYWLENGDRKWRAARVLDISREGAGVELFAVEPKELRSSRVVLEVMIPPALLRLTGRLTYLCRGDHGGLRVGLHFAGMSVYERDLFEAFMQNDADDVEMPSVDG
jgi:hypothetical protein